MALPTLNHQWLSLHGDVDSFAARRVALPERVIQFGEGVFLRGFVDWMLDSLNRVGAFNGRVVVIQPLPTGMADQLNQQDGLYTLLLRGVVGASRTGSRIENRVDNRIASRIENRIASRVDSRQIISSISRAIDPYTDYNAFLRSASLPHARYIVSNTTEAGIAFDPSDAADHAPPVSFAGKLTAWLFARFQAFNGDDSKGMLILPCELIDCNGEELRRCVLLTARHWSLPTEFVDWIDRANRFFNTLVDRIVAGYPADEAAELQSRLGYHDALLNSAEFFHSWVIEGSAALADDLPFHRAGLNVRFTDDLRPFRDRKVRILNGGHTGMCFPALLSGKETVRDAVEDAVLGPFIRQMIYREIIPSLDVPLAESEAFADAVMDRFSNPFIRHALSSIALNAASKFNTRVVPSIVNYHRRTGALPTRSTFALSALIVAYRPSADAAGAQRLGHALAREAVRDGAGTIQQFHGAWNAYAGTRESAVVLTRRLLQDHATWDPRLGDVPSLADAVGNSIHDIIDRGIDASIKSLG